MSSLQESRSEETKRAILASAGQLFSEKGYETVSMRQIAQAAGCSHTTIYIYFKDKETLLHRLAAPPLEELRLHMEAVLGDPAKEPDERLRDISRAFIQFCLSNRSMYAVFFAAGAGRVDDAEPSLAINKQRNEMFGLLQRALGDTLGLAEGDRLLACSRIYFFLIHGIASTYAHSSESADELMGRLASTFDTAIDTVRLGLGIQQRQLEKEAGS